MDNSSTRDQEAVEDALISIITNGGTFKEISGFSDEAMESVYAVAYNLFQGNKFDDAAKVFQFLAFQDHFNPKYFLGLGACQQMRKQYQSAIEIFSFASLLDANDPRPFTYIGDCYIALDDTEKAKLSYEMAIRCDGDNSAAKQDIKRAKAMLKNIAK